ncbi:hypothetical protein DF16_pBMB293orf00132 (plasmid) [Bacillus thuringiensis serovar kurstaki str. YBT-1520]|nr:hypothetical protein H175_285p205 [Bacillus thuringiensis serovar thuringiensis str. IS5056]AHZ54921.1 hypothetical protein YBT1520_32116 [Bacillus thuringiensis serovar kurstaki str. YBT-1520]AIE37369.1 hypothetical protein BTK_32166 [Bacillus thuringiensis serovar kurstaki str. HD-1]AIM34656.1 hypothetical protein DF16_pBMB293orf00132 [Bacillus thuringiensis serovar kurstaki str. YBT-1520]
MKIARTVWGGGKGGDYFKVLPIAPEMGSGYLNPYGLRCHT